MSHADPQGLPVGAAADPCPSAEAMAEYLEDRISPFERAALEEHLLLCADCREIVVETATDASDSAAIQGSTARSWKVGAALLVWAAALALAIRLVMPQFASAPPTSADGSTRGELVAALRLLPVRPGEGRFSGGFAYADPPLVFRGEAGSTISSDVRIAAANIQKRAESERSSTASAAFGVALMVVGEFDKGIDMLEQVVRETPTAATFQSDLAAAYLARARYRDRADDWPRALAAAERAIQQDKTLAEAYFNRALALEGLHLYSEARAAWNEYQRIDPASDWTREAADRGARLRQAPAGRGATATPPGETYRQSVG